MYDPIAFTNPEGIDLDSHIVATYLYQTAATANIHKLANALSEEQSSGTWVSLEGETPEVRQRHTGKIVAIWEVPDFEESVPDDLRTRNWVLQIAYPVHNIGPQIPLMLTTVNGNIASAGRLKLLDLNLPSSYTDGVQGSKVRHRGHARAPGRARAAAASSAWSSPPSGLRQSRAPRPSTRPRWAEPTA